MIGFVPTPVLRPSREADCPHHHAAVCSAAPAAPNARTAVLAAAVGAAVISCGFVQPASGVVSAPECYNGVGPGCDAAAEEAPIIRELLERSRANKAENERKTLETYWDKGFKSYFSFGYDKDLVKKEDGTYTLKRPESLIGKTLRGLGALPPGVGDE